MSFKFNWGTGIFTFIALFLLGMVVLVYFSMQQRNDLVETEYYPQGLEYQNQIDRISNADKLTGKFIIEQKDEMLLIKYPDDLAGKDVKGLINMFRPSDIEADVIDSLKFDSALVQRIPLAELKAGRYIAKISWTMDGKEYYHEEGVRIAK
ncbi:MAG: hypothetical protein HGA37_00895 [Lentimicrobium sp.]|nr:hypothetical protein [Lentimicrobium sp.]